LGTFSGRSLDAGYYPIVYPAGCFLVVFGIFMASLGTEYWHILLAQGICCGFGSGMIFCPTLALASTYFQKRRSLALGIGASGSATGGVIIPLVVEQLLDRIGFAWTMRTVGLVCVVALLISNAVLKTRLPPRKTGSLVEWAAFKEPTYVLFTLGKLITPPAAWMIIDGFGT
jgi:MFS family permease